jgi:hypothetical protein
LGNGFTKRFGSRGGQWARSPIAATLEERDCREEERRKGVGAEPV